MSSEAAQGIVILGMPRVAQRSASTRDTSRYLLSTGNQFVECCGALLGEEAGGVSAGCSGLSFAGIAEPVVIARLREFVFGFCRISAVKGRNVGPKRPPLTFHLDQIEQLCGGSCRFLCLVRHPLDVIARSKITDKMETYVAELHTYIASTRAPLEAFAHAWVEMHARLRCFVSDHPNIASC
jgi:hypothetical protein